MAGPWAWLTSRFGRSTDECPECHSEVGHDVTICKVCGYDLVRKSRDDSTGLRGPA